MYFLYREYSPYRRELIAQADDEDGARAMACDHSRRDSLVISVRQFVAGVGEGRQVCAFLQGTPHIAA